MNKLTASEEPILLIYPFTGLESAQRSFLMDIFSICQKEREYCLANWKRLTIHPPKSSHAHIAIKVISNQVKNHSEKVYIVKNLALISHDPQFSQRIGKRIHEIPDLFPYLAHLSLTCQSLAALSSNFCDLFDLQYLHLEGDDLSQLPPSFFHQMPELSHLRIDLPRLLHFPTLNFRMSYLTHVILRNLPHISALPSFFEFLPQLEDLYLGRVGITTLPSGFFECTALETLKILCCPQFTSFPEIDINHIPSMDQQVFPSLNWVELKVNPLLHRLPDYLLQSSNLEVLHCAQCPQLHLLPHQERIASHLIGLVLDQCGTANTHHFRLPKQPLDFTDD